MCCFLTWFPVICGGHCQSQQLSTLFKFYSVNTDRNWYLSDQDWPLQYWKFPSKKTARNNNSSGQIWKQSGNESSDTAIILRLRERDCYLVIISSYRRKGMTTLSSLSLVWFDWFHDLLKASCIFIIDHCLFLFFVWTALLLNRNSKETMLIMKDHSVLMSHRLLGSVLFTILTFQMELR